MVRRERGVYRRVASGVIRTTREETLAARLVLIYRGLSEVLALHQPDVVAIEAIFKHKSSQSALKLGHARGVALLAAAQAGLPIFEYHASHVKNALTGFGAADKDQLARVVSMLLGETLDGPKDESDALAIAITHLAHARFQPATPPGRTP